jgi:hypothetical protein
MIKYRPHRGSIDKAMEEMKTFDDIADMLDYISEQHHRCFAPDDIVISESYGEDKRIGWNSWRYVCTRYYRGEDLKHPQCIGMCDFGELD